MTLHLVAGTIGFVAFLLGYGLRAKLVPTPKRRVQILADDLEALEGYSSKPDLGLVRAAERSLCANMLLALRSCHTDHTWPSSKLRQFLVRANSSFD